MELGVAGLEKGGLALLVFTDADLASTYERSTGDTGKKPTVLNPQQFAALLEQIRPFGITHVVIDHSPGKPPSAAGIEKVIAAVEARI
jgi:hypothetical protein